MKKLYANVGRGVSKRYSCSVADFTEQLTRQNPQLAQTMRWNFDTSKSHGQFFVDSEGTSYLDAFMQISSIPLGYNNPELKAAVACDEVLSMIVSRPAMGVLPPASLTSLLEKPLTIAPKGMDHIQTLMCGSCTVENAMKTTIGNFMYKQRGGEPPSALAHSSCMDGLQPGSFSGVVMAFRGGFHGRTFGALTLTNSKSAIKVDMPAFDWPHAPFPKLKYPLEDHVRENAEEEARCLAEMEEILYVQREINKPVAAVIVEPIQGEGGDTTGSDYFFRNVVDLTRKYGASMIVDEVQTGFGATGKWWAHEYWGLDEPVDIMCFAKKATACGYYYKKEFAHNPDTRIFNTWMGEPVKLAIMSKAIEIIIRDQLLENVNKVGEVIQSGFRDLESRHQGLFHSGRGRGLYCAISLDTPEHRDKAVKMAMDKGLMVGPCGPNSIRMRPSLNFTTDNAETTLTIIDTIGKELRGVL